MFGDEILDNMHLLLLGGVSRAANRHSMPPISFAAFMHPSRAWSKNGLFIAFGTRAKTLSLASGHGLDRADQAASDGSCTWALPGVAVAADRDALDDWWKRKVRENGAAKLVPDAATLGEAREALVREKRAKARLAE
jgi:hypothetical protein